MQDIYTKILKSRRFWKVFIPVILFTLISGGLFLFKNTPEEVSAGWWNESWNYRKAIQITNNTTTETDVYIELTLDTSAITTIQPDCGDLRFTTENGQILNYYIVSGCGTASNIININFETFPAGLQNIYFYYGNPSAENGFSLSDFTTVASNYIIGAVGSEEVGLGPVGHWSFDEGYGTTAHDSSSGNNDGIITGATWQDESMCLSGKCLYFDGESSYVEIPDSDLMDINGEMTLEAWIKTGTTTKQTIASIGEEIEIYSKRLGGTGDDYIYDTTVDTNNNLIVVGRVTGNADLNGDGDSSDGGAETAFANYGLTDGIISVFSSSGVHQWSKRFGGVGNDIVYGVTTDSSNNIIITGLVTGDADLNGDGDSSDGGAETATATYGLTDGFISVFNSSGVHQWSKRLGGISGDQGTRVVTDTNNNIILVGTVTGNADLNGDGDSSDGGAETATATYDLTDVFISVFNSSGIYQRSKRLGGVGNDSSIAITTDSDNRIIVEGHVTGNADINGDGDSSDGGAETAGGIYGGYDVFISVFNSSGTYQWSKRLGGVVTDLGLSVTTDTNNNIIVAGAIAGQVDLNGDRDSSDGGAEATSGIYGGLDSFISVFNSSGTYQWAKRMGGTGTDAGIEIITDTNNNVILAGYATGNADLNGDGDSSDGGAETATVTYGTRDITVSVFNSFGIYQWSKRLGGINDDLAQSITRDNDNNIIIAGVIIGDADLNGDDDSSDGGAETVTATYGLKDASISYFSNTGGVPVKNNGYDLFYENNNFSFKSGELISFNSSDTAVNDNSWEHIVYRRNSTNEAFYLNGILLNESAITGYINSNVANLLIGIENASGTNPFLGFIDEVKIYPYARTSDQIKQDYNAGLAGVSTSKGTSVSFGSQSDSWMSDGLVGYWKMDETATTSGAVDSSGNGNDGIYIGNASTTGGRFGNGGIFDGDSDFVSLSGLGTINTISFWVNANSDTEKIMELLEWSCGDTVYNENDGITYQTILADDGNCWLASNLGTSNIATAYNDSNAYGAYYQWGRLADGHQISTSGTTGTRSTTDVPGHDNFIFYSSLPSDWRNPQNDNLWQSPNYTNNPCPDGWNIPTSVEWSSLVSTEGITNYTNAFSSSLKLTAGGYRYRVDGSLANQGAGGFYWSSTVNGVDSYCTYFTSSSIITNNLVHRASGFPARCIYKDATVYPSVSISNGTIQTSNITAPTIYIDGEISSSIDTGWHHVVISSNTDINTNALNIGKIGSNFLDGRVDEVRVYNRALSESEVKKLYEWAPGPVLHLKMDEKQGTTSFDTSGYGNDGTLGGDGLGTDLPEWTRGKYGNALSFDSDDDDVHIADSNSIDIGRADLTIGAWVLFNDTTTEIKNIILKRATTDAGDPGYNLSYNKTDSNLLFNISDGARTAVSSDDISIEDNKWHYLSVSADRSGDAIFYLDGIQSGSGDISAADGGNISNSFDLLISNWNNSYEWGGKIDDVRIYNYARTQKQILEDMNGGGPASKSPVAYWKFDEGYGATVHDSSLSQNNGTVTPDVGGANTNVSQMWSLDGREGRAIEFDGTDDYISLSTLVDLSSSDIFTISAWIKPSNLNRLENIIELGQTNGHAIWKNATGGFYAGTVFTTAGWTEITSDNSSLSTTEWQHIIYTYDGASQKIYLNGEIIKSNPIIDEFSTPTGNAYLGNGGGGDKFTGLIDEVKIYNFAMNDDEIKQEYNGGVGASFGSTGTDASGDETNSASREYCVPGDTAQCDPPVMHLLSKQKSGISWPDISGNGNDGTLSGAVWDRGKIGNGLKLNGTSDYIKVDNSLSLNNLKNSGQLTIEGWMNYDGDSQPLTETLFSLYFSNEERIYSRWIDNGGGSAGVGLVQITNGVSDLSVISLEDTVVSGWHHIVWSVDGSTNNVWIDGKNVLNELATKSITNLDDGYDFYAGFMGQDYYFEGSLDDIRIYNYIRTPAQIAYEYNKGKPVAHWDFDECSGTIAHDQTPSTGSEQGGNHGTITIGASGTQTETGTCASSSSASAWYNGRDGSLNSALSFDGTDDYISVGDTSLDINAISFWTKQDYTDNYFIDLDGGTSTITLASGNIQTTGFTSPTVYVDGLAKTNIPNNAWHQVTVVTDTAMDANNLSIGKIGTDYYTGLFDEIKLFNYPLTATQIKSNYSGGAVNFGGGSVQTGTALTSYCDDSFWNCSAATTCENDLGDGNYILVADADESGTYRWKTTNTDCDQPQCNINGGQDGDNLVADNTVTFGATYPAREACKAIGGRLPTKSELGCIYMNKADFGDNFTSHLYWSATEYSTAGAWYHYFSDGSEDSPNKTNMLYVHCVTGW